MSTVPPKLDENLVEIFSGGDRDWLECPPFKLFTNAFIVHEENGKILLGMKKRGFGMGMYNGFGGKVEEGETPVQAAARELKEESGILANLQPAGILLFVNAGHGYSHYIHIYRASEYEDEPVETEEMRPEWFAIPNEYLNPGVKGDSSLPPIPYDKMWPDDEFWMPLLLQGQFFVGRADFRKEDESDGREGRWVMERWWFGKKP